jgi:hypothetical protein
MHALGEYERQRNQAAMPAFELNFQFATVQPDCRISGS